MAYTLQIKGKETITFGRDMIYYVHVEVNTPSDSRAKSTDTAATMWISGKLLSTEDMVGNSATVKLFEWSLVPASSADSYRDVSVEVIIYDEQVFRKIDFPNAFVVDYSERYSNTSGVGDFSMVLRQRVDKMTDIKAQGAL